jgi:hypothetical protein
VHFDQIRMMRLKASEARGPVYARGLGAQLVTDQVRPVSRTVYSAAQHSIQRSAAKYTAQRSAVATVYSAAQHSIQRSAAQRPK